jgi:hypothetical protein
VLLSKVEDRMIREPDTGSGVCWRMAWWCVGHFDWSGLVT